LQDDVLDDAIKIGDFGTEDLMKEFVKGLEKNIGC